MPQKTTQRPTTKRFLVISFMVLGIVLVLQYPKLAKLLSSHLIDADKPISSSTGLLKSALVEPGDWLTFTSETNSFTIEYPPNWDVSLQDTDEGGSNIYFKLKNPTENQYLITVGVGVTPVASATTLEKWVKQQLARPPHDNNLPVTERASLTIDGIAAREIEGLRGYTRSLHIFLVRDNKTYSFWVQPYDSKHPQFSQWITDLDTLFHHMVASVRFTETELLAD